MYKLKGFVFVNGITVPIPNDIFVSGWDEVFKLVEEADTTHYLLTLV